MIIGVSGKIGSGKDTFADKLIEYVKSEYGFTFENKKYAYNLKKIVSILTGVSMEDVFSREGKHKQLPEWNMTVGEMQQKLGTEAVRNNINQDAWILSLFGTYSTKKYWIITDVRFKNEADIIKEKGGIVIRLNGDPIKSKTNDNRNMEHPSETGLDDYQDFDYIYDNVPPIENLIEFVKEVSDKIFNYVYE